MSHPKVTVLMPVYNCEKYLNEAIESVLNQNFRDFEFLIINDGSTDKSVEIINNYKDSRIKLLHNGKNLGISNSRNRGLKLARGKYVVLMDSDDISLPHRIEKQVAYMDKHAEIGICGTWIESIGIEEGKRWQCPTEHERICFEMLFLCSMAQPSVIMRKDTILSNNLFYDESFTLAGDYDYWTRAAKITRLANIPEVLLSYRVYERPGDRKDIRERFTEMIIKRQLRDLLNRFSEKEYVLHRSLVDHNFVPSISYLEDVNNWLTRLRNANRIKTIYDIQTVEWVLAHKWFQACRKLSMPEMLKWGKFREYSFSYFSAFTLVRKIKSVYYFLRIMFQDIRKKRKAYEQWKNITEDDLNNPAVSIVMPVHNGEKYLREAIESILNQTFKDYELLIIDDGSTDKSVEIMGSFKDKRIRLVHNEKNLGISKSCNKGIKYARGKYIARMDADDISLPERIEKQALFMEKNHHIGICGTWTESIGDIEGYIWQPPVEHKRICVELLFLCPLAHPTVMMRKESLYKNDLFYDENLDKLIEPAEDYELWVRAGRVVRLANIPEVMLKHREYGRVQDYLGLRKAATEAIRKKQLSDLGVNFTEEEYSLHASLVNMDFMPTKEYSDKIYAWFNRLLYANKKKNIYDQQMLEWVMAHKLFQTLRQLSILELLKWNKFWQYSYSFYSAFTLPQKIKSIYFLSKIVFQDIRSLKRADVK